MTEYLTAYAKGGGAYQPSTKQLTVGASCLAPLEIPAEDRNRTSPFPYGGHRFEFRAVGSSQNVSMVNTVLCTAIADSFKEFVDEIKDGKKPQEVAAAALEAHFKCIFNGNGYSAEWPKEAEARGVWRIDSGVEAMSKLTDAKNLELFEKMNVMTKKESTARAEVMFGQYAGIVEIEAKTMIDMIQMHVLPDCKKAGLAGDVISGLERGISSLEAGLATLASKESEYDKAKEARVLRLETMEAVRGSCDAAEGLVPPSLWTLATYKELLFP